MTDMFHGLGLGKKKMMAWWAWSFRLLEGTRSRCWIYTNGFMWNQLLSEIGF